MMKANMMKTFAVLTAASMTLSLLAGCSAKKETVEEQPKQEEAAQVANPLTEVSREELAELTGVALDAPADADVAHYFTLEAEGNLIAQVNFSCEGVSYIYRAQPADGMEAYDLSGIFADSWEEDQTVVGGYCDAVVKTSKEGAVIYWMDIAPGINYTLATTDEVSAETMVAMAEEVFVPAQGNADGETEEENEAFLIDNGHYEDDGFNTLDIAYGGMGVYDLTIGINRLSEFPGSGRIEEGCLMFHVEAPDGSEITGCFFPNEDGTCSMVFTDSKWDLLESGTMFEGFRYVPKDFTGRYLDGAEADGCDIVTLSNKAEDGTYDIDISIFRLAEFEGKATQMGDDLEFVVEDPNGGELTGYFYSTDSETYMLLFTDSQWNLLESGTAFENFVVEAG